MHRHPSRPRLRNEVATAQAMGADGRRWATDVGGGKDVSSINLGKNISSGAGQPVSDKGTSVKSMEVSSWHGAGPYGSFFCASS